jgi:hypothetical protein
MESFRRLRPHESRYERFSVRVYILTSLSIACAGKGSRVSAVPTAPLLESVTCHATVHLLLGPRPCRFLPSGAVSMSQRSARGPPCPSHRLGLRVTAWKFVWGRPVGGVKIGAQNVPPPAHVPSAGIRVFFFTPFFTPFSRHFSRRAFSYSCSHASTNFTPRWRSGARSAHRHTVSGRRRESVRGICPRTLTPAPPV